MRANPFALRRCRTGLPIPASLRNFRYRAHLRRVTAFASTQRETTQVRQASAERDLADRGVVRNVRPVAFFLKIGKVGGR
jgi:hypothetical protein